MIEDKTMSSSSDVSYNNNSNSSNWILVGMAAGVFVGLFFGEMSLRIKFIGDAFINLLQMTILPYVIVSLMLGFGSLSIKNAKKLATHGGLLMIAFWGIGLLLVFSLASSFPEAKHLTFFSSTKIADNEEENIVSMFISANFIQSVAEGAVPAVVLFSIVFGVTLMKIEDRDDFLGMLKVLRDVFENMNELIFKISPIGIFAITATAAGSLRPEKLSSMQVYLVTFVVGALLVSLFLLPYLISSLYGRRFGASLESIRSALVLAFTSGNSFIVLPLIKDSIKNFFDNDNLIKNRNIKETEILIPVIYNFPSIGILLTLIFIPFTGWMYDRDLMINQQIMLAFSGLVNLFGDPEIAIPFLLDSMSLPADAFELFILSNIITDPFVAVMEVMCVFSFSIIYIGISSGGLKISLLKYAKIGLVFILSTAIVVVVIRLILSASVTRITTEKDILDQMVITEPVATTISRNITGETKTINHSNDLLSVIQDRGVLRVGYNSGAMPFAFFNKNSDLVGFDIAMAHDLAKNLGVSLHFEPFLYSDIGSDLASGRYDIAMSSVTINFDRLREMDFTNHYMRLHLAFLVPDNQRHRFSNKAHLMNRKELKIAVMRGSAFIPTLARYLPHAEIVELDTREQFFTQHVADAMLTTAEQGASWSLRYPFTSVVTPDVPIGNDFVGYAIAKGNPELLQFLNHWINMFKMSSKSDTEYKYWVMGKSLTEQQPRWSILRDVLGWQ